MGYFKSIEQFLFSYISLHTIEKDSVNRKIFAGAKPLDTLSDKLLNDSSKVKNINLKSIRYALGRVHNINRVLACTCGTLLFC